jgi:uncharacterized protein with PQ loop repeat
MLALDAPGFFTRLFAASSFVPPVWRTWNAWNVSGASLSSHAAIAASLAFWLVYGLLRGDASFMAVNAEMGVMAAALAATKIAFGPGVTTGTESHGPTQT